MLITTRMGLALMGAIASCGVAAGSQAQQRLYEAASSDIMQCVGQGSIGRQLLERSPGHFGCGLSENMTTPPLSARYATISATRSVVGDPRVQLFCPGNRQARNAHREAGAVVVLERLFDPQRRPDIANTLIRDAMRMIYARCPIRPLGTPSMGFVQIAAPSTPGGQPRPLGEVRNYGLGIWFDESWGQAARQTLALRWSPSPSPVPPAGPPPRTTANGDQHWLRVRSVEQRPTTAEWNGIRGRLGVEAQTRPSFTLLAYSNGANDGSTVLSLAPHQCTQLIVRYAQGLGLADIVTTRDVGDGKDVAQNFEARSGGRFVFHDGRGSPIPPYPGAVISIAATATDGTPWRNNPYGHVGIAQEAKSIGDDEIEVVLFDQNFPLPSGQWKRLRFSRVGGNWTGTMTNSVSGIAQTLRVAGWANPALQLTTASNSPAAPDAFRDCQSGCPEMVILPPGQFSMQGGNYGGGSQLITISRSFAVGKFEVTFNEWNACVVDGWCPRPSNVPYESASDHGWGRANRPVINVNWAEANLFTEWLSFKTGRRYRLLSEAEWEYAARAGSETPYGTGGEGLTAVEANIGRVIDRTTAVGSYAPNPFGLHDMHGNVMEWVADCEDDTFWDQTPTDGSARLSGSCDRRINRGGSWNIQPNDLPIAERQVGTPDIRYPFIGFRVARSL